MQQNGHVPEKAIALCTDELKRDESNITALLARTSAWAALNVGSEMSNDFAAARDVDSAEASAFFEHALSRYYARSDISPSESVDTLKVFAAAFGDIGKYAALKEAGSTSKPEPREISVSRAPVRGASRRKSERSVAVQKTQRYAEGKGQVDSTTKISRTNSRRSHLRVRKTSDRDTVASLPVRNDQISGESQEHEASLHQDRFPQSDGLTVSATPVPTQKKESLSAVSAGFRNGPAGLLEQWDVPVRDKQKNGSRQSIATLVEHIPYNERIALQDIIDRCAKSYPEIPSQISRNMCLGNHLYKKQAWSKAMTAYLNVLKEAPGHMKALCMLSRCIGNCGYYDLALTYIDKSIDRNPEYGEAWFVRAWIYHCMGNRDREVANLREALRLGYDRRGYTTARLRLLGADR
ncbi:MAG: hypothetical protein GF401_18775 [Chitinivibrionales bacterium]|nr:hypothetical protein [Chitinivibrionales bacterium]